MPTKLTAGGYQAAASLSPQAGRIARLSIDDYAPILGTISDVTSPHGVNASMFRVDAAGYDLPLVPAEQYSARLSLVITRETLPDYLQTPDRQALLTRYSAFCSEHSLTFDLYAALNVIFWIEQDGGLPESPLDQAAALVRYRRLFYTFLDALARRLS